MITTTLRGRRAPARPLSAASVLLASVALGLGCGAPDDGGAAPAGRANVEKVQSFLYWEPSAALVTEHANWHGQPCGVNGGRSCSQPGANFLLFHRDFLRRLRADFTAKGLSGDLTPWYALPPEMKNPANGWTAELQTAENNIMNFVNAAGQRFTSLDAFGSYIENNYHGALHGIASRAYGGTCPTGSSAANDCAVSAPGTSPKSTYFFKIHGLVDWHLERFLRGDFNRDGKGDLLVTNVGTGANEIRLLNDTSTTSTVALPTVTGCGYYQGAAGDFNGDGFNDIVWHGPSCSQVAIWFMNGTALSTSTAALPAVNNAYQLIGSGDFTNDRDPDMVWRELANGTVHIWKMKGAVYQSSILIPIAASEGQVVLVADFDDNGTPDFLLRQSSGSSVTYKIQRMSGTSFVGPAFPIGLASSPFFSPAGTGRYSSADRYPDIAMLADAPAPLPRTLNHFFGLWNGASIVNSTTQATGVNMYVRGPR